MRGWSFQRLSDGKGWSLQDRGMWWSQMNCTRVHCPESRACASNRPEPPPPLLLSTSFLPPSPLLTPSPRSSLSLPPFPSLPPPPLPRHHTQNPKPKAESPELPKPHNPQNPPSPKTTAQRRIRNICRTLRSLSLRAMRKQMSWQRQVRCGMRDSWRKREQRQSSRSERRSVPSLAVCSKLSLFRGGMERL